eukprot:Phypoly_transcript_09917.p1 GENE.Phypoly_transcript_09917~~Phypoly_transcript_09917.p1  ORF type:complete len:388 (+),score=43.73 Phypoly_transcript_09917:153-1316(+)
MQTANSTSHKFDAKWTEQEVVEWVKSLYPRVPTLASKFVNISGADMEGYDKEDMIAISGDSAIGRALYNRIHQNAPNRNDQAGSHPAPAKSEPSFFENYVNSTRVDKNLIDRAIRYFPARVLVVRTEEQAQQLMNDVSAIPETSTAQLMLDENDIIINGPLCPNLPTKSAFLYGFRGTENGLFSQVIKIPKAEQVDHELNIWRQIQTLEHHQDRFVPVELLKFKAGTPMAVKKAILMPVYPATLQHPPTIPDKFLYEIGIYVKGSLDLLHSLNLAHCDIKPPNLFLSPEGKVIIGDYGAAGPIGSALAETSKAYLAEELLFSTVGELRCKEIDYCMLATSLLEKRAQWTRTTCTMEDLRSRANSITHHNLKLLINHLLYSAAKPSGV